MDKGRGLGSAGNGFIPQDSLYGQSNDPDGQKNNTTKVQTGTLPELSRKRKNPFNSYPNNQKFFRRTVQHVNHVKNTYINGQVRSGLVDYIRSALADGKEIKVNNASQGNQTLVNLNKQLNKVISDIKGSKDLISIREQFQEKAKKISADNPVEVAQVVVDLSSDLGDWARNGDWLDAKSNAKKLREIDDKLKEILKHFIVDTGGSSGSGFESDLETEWDCDVSEADWIDFESDDESFITPAESVATQTPGTLLKDASTEIEEGYGSEPDLESEKDFGADDAESEVQEYRGAKRIVEQVPQFWATTENLGKAQYHQVKIEHVEENLPASSESIATQTPDTRLKDASTEIREGQLPDPKKEELNELRDAASRAIEAAEAQSEQLDEMKGKVAEAQDNLRDAEKAQREAESNLAASKERSGKLEEDNGQLKVAVTEARSNLSQAQQKLAAAREQNRQLRGENDGLKSDVLKAKEKQHQAEHSLKGLQSDLAATEAKLKSSIKNEGVITREVTKQKSLVEGQNKELEEKSRKLKELEERLKDVSSQKSGLENRLRETDKAMIALENANAELMAKQEEANIKIITLEKEKEKNDGLYRDRIKDVQKKRGVEYETYKKEIEDLNARVEDLLQRNNDFETEVSDLQGREKQAVLEKYNQELEFQGYVQEFEIKLNSFKNGNDKVEKDNEGLRLQLDDMGQENNRLNIDKTAKELEVRALQHQTKDLKKSNKELTDQLRSAQSEVQDAKLEVDKQLRKIAQRERRHEKVLDQVEKERQELSGKLDEVLLDKLKLVKEKGEVGYKYAREEEKYKEEISRLNEEIGKQRAALDESERVNDDSQKELTILRKNNSIWKDGFLNIVERQRRMLPGIDSASSDSELSNPESKDAAELEILKNIRMLEKIEEGWVGFKDGVIKEQKDLLVKMRAATNDCREVLASHEARLKAFQFKVTGVDAGGGGDDEAQRGIKVLERQLKELTDIKDSFMESAELVAKEIRKKDNLKKDEVDH